MKRYMHIAFVAVVGLGYISAHASEVKTRWTMEEMQRMNPDLTIQVLEEPKIGQLELQIANQIEFIQRWLNQDLTGYSNAELVRWYGQGDDHLTALLRIGGSSKRMHLMDEYRKYKQQFQDKFNEHGGILPGGKRAGQTANQPVSASPVRARQGK